MMECLFLKWPRHRKLKPAHIRRLTLSILYFNNLGHCLKEFNMALAQLKWSLPAEDAADASSVDVFDGAALIGSVAANVAEFSTPDLTPGDHSFTVVVRSRAGAQFDSDASNAAAVTVPAPSVKLTAVSDLTAVLA